MKYLFLSAQSQLVVTCGWTLLIHDAYAFHTFSKVVNAFREARVDASIVYVTLTVSSGGEKLSSVFIVVSASVLETSIA